MIRRAARLLFAVAALFYAWPSTSLPQTPDQLSPQVAVQNLQRPDQDTPRELFYPRYSLKEGYESKLYLMDRSPHPIDFTISVHSLSGDTVISKKMTIEPPKDLVIDVREVLTDLKVDYRGEFVEGTLSVNFTGAGNPLGGRMLVAGPNETQNIGPVWNMGEFGQNMIPPSLNTFWHALGGTRDVLLTVNNVTSEPVIGDIHLDIGGKRYSPPALQFAPYQTHQISLTEMLAKLRMTAYQAPIGGLSIVPRGGPSLIAAGYIADPDSGAQTPLPFPAPQKQRGSALHTTGLPIGRPTPDSPFAGYADANFTPHFYLRNLLDSEQTITFSVEVPTANGPLVVPLDPIKIPGFVTQDVSLDKYYYELPLPLPLVTLRAAFTGPPGTIIGAVDVINETNGEVLPMGVRAEGDGYAASLASEWDFDDQTDFVVFFTDMGEKDCRVGLRLDAGGVSYDVPVIRLTPHETRWFSLRELRDHQVPDARGHLLPKDVTEGRLFYNRMDMVPMIGRVDSVPRIPR